jgi:hypothetical protein
MATWAQFESEASQFAAMVRTRFEAAETHILATLRKDGSPFIGNGGAGGPAKGADVADSEPPGGSHAFQLELREAVIIAVEGDELVVRFWRPGLGVRTVRRR